ncbi:MAG: hypothetical protein HRU24_13145 [Gammaproteobacteria bacterium]|nr:hypothetical protein [Gammaproteobacteria bacterium]
MDKIIKKEQIEPIIKVSDDDTTSEINSTAASLVSINTKIYVVLLLSIVFNIIQGFLINLANERAENNTELMFVKMYPNGTWDIEFRKSGEEADYFPLIIDKHIHDYVESRFGVNPHAMSRNYGFALIFMSDTLANSFVGNGEGQYYAAQKAIDFTKRGITEKIEIRFTDHFDVSSGVFVNGNSDVYRTNIFIERTTINSDGFQQGKPIREVVNLHWRLKNFKELKRFSRDQLRANPIGLEIIQEKINYDNSVTK